MQKECLRSVGIFVFIMNIVGKLDQFRLFIVFRRLIFADTIFMLDKRSEALLRIINRECNEGSYKVIEIDDIIRFMPRKFRVDLDTINQLMGYLKAGEYVSIKYSDNEVFCVSPLPRGRRVFEVEREEKKMSKKNKFKFVLLSLFYLMLIFGACIGAAYVARLL